MASRSIARPRSASREGWRADLGRRATDSCHARSPPRWNQRTRVAVLTAASSPATRRAPPPSLIVGNAQGRRNNGLPGILYRVRGHRPAKDAFSTPAISSPTRQYERMTARRGEDADIELDGRPARGQRGGREPPRRPRARAPRSRLSRTSSKGLTSWFKVRGASNGARITSFISLPGRYLVYMPQVNHRCLLPIHDAAERDRLRRRPWAAATAGFIV
jgi:hypothetical protein